VNRILLGHADGERSQRLMVGLQRSGFAVAVVRELAAVPRSAAVSSAAILATDIAGEGTGARGFFQEFVRGLVLFRPDLPLITMARQPDAELSVAMARLNVDWHFGQEPDVALLAAQVGRLLGEWTLPQPVRTGGEELFSLDLEQRILHFAGARVRLSPRELTLLALLLQQPGRVYARDEIIAALHPQVFVANERAVDVIVSRLRQKLITHLDAHSGAWLRTVTGVGYTFRPPGVGKRPETA
jgi:DNA-binding response OmpR family regulator